MITTYKVHNPYTGLYKDSHTIDELKQSLAEHAWEAYKTLCHNQPYTIVEIKEDGSQTWKTPQGDVIPIEYIIEAIKNGFIKGENLPEITN